MIQTAIYGYGNLGRAVRQCLQKTPDMRLCGIYTRRAARRGEKSQPLSGLSGAVRTVCRPVRSGPAAAGNRHTKGLQKIPLHYITAGRRMSMASFPKNPGGCPPGRRPSGTGRNRVYNRP